MSDLSSKVEEIKQDFKDLDTLFSTSASENEIKRKLETTDKHVKTWAYETDDRELIRKLRNQVNEYQKKLDFKAPNKYGDISTNEDKAIEYGNELHSKITDKTEEALEIVTDTFSEAIEVATKVQKQTNDLERINNGLNEANTETDKAGKIINRMQRRNLSMKYLMWFIVFIIVIIVLVIIIVLFT